MDTILLSIKPIYAQRIFKGEKLFEFRKRLCRKGISKIIFYVTAPVCKILGEAEIENILADTPSNLYEKTKHAAGIEKELFDFYFQNSSIGYAYQLKNILEYHTPKNLSDYHIKHAPQSFVYLA